MTLPFNSSKEVSLNCSTIVDLLHYRSLSQPKRQAFTFLDDGETQESILTYQELDRRSRAIASQLQAMGMSGERALLLYPPGLDYLAAFFGCLYAGVVAVPAYPPRNQRKTQRIQAIVADALSAIALTTTAILPTVQSLLTEKTDRGNFQLLTTDNLPPGIEDSWQRPLIDTDALAFLQYTSGSTGTPKGVMLSHGNLLHNAAVTYRLMEHSSSSKFVSWLPIYHDMGLIGGILQPLYGGFPCILMSPKSFLQRPYRWLQAISQNKATTSGGPNFAYEHCIQKITPQQLQTLDLSSWSVAFNGAEPIRQDTLEKFAATFAECGFRPEAFYPCYGMAEATLIVTGGSKKTVPDVKTVDKSALSRNQAIAACTTSEDIQTFISCGQTVPQQQIVIVNPETLTCCQPDEVGEIWVSGPSVGRGYWNRQEETEQIFRAHLKDFANSPFLRTGDLGFLQNGELFITGRAKDLIIIRGRNLYPQDIELTAERSHSSLRLGSGAAFSLEVGNEEQLFVVQELEFRAKPNIDEVIAAIRQAVVLEHEVQVYAVVLIKPGSIPKTSSGKIQRRGTRAEYMAGNLNVVGSSIFNYTNAVIKESRLQRADILALNPEDRQSILESYLQEQVSQVLLLVPQEINLQQPLSSFGLDSLKVFELKNRIEADLEVAVSVAELFEELSVRSLSTKILAQLTTVTSLPSVSLTPTNKDKSFHPLSFAQQQLWFIHQLAPDSPAYNISLSINFKGGVDTTVITKCLNEIIKRHEVLRTNFVIVEGQPVQVIKPAFTLTLPIVDLQQVLESKRTQEVQRLTTELGQQLFDLSSQPLLSAKLLRLSEQDYQLLLTLHHIVADGWSIGIFIRELTALYQAFSHDKPVLLPELPIKYVDFTYWQRQWLQGERIQSLTAYWQQQLGGKLPILDLPTDRPRSAFPTFKGAQAQLVLPLTLIAALKNLSHQEGATLFMTLLAAFKVLLYRYTGQTDILVGSPVASRHRAGIEALIGFFINILVLRSQLSGELSFRDLLLRVKLTALAAYVHQDLPFEKLVQELQPERDLSYNPLFQVMFAFQNIPMPTPELSDISITCQEGYNNTAKFDLSLLMTESEQGLVATIEYNIDLFNLDTITRMLGYFQTILVSIVGNPDQCIGELPLLSASQKQQLIVEWNQTKTDYPQNQCIHQLFEAQVEQTPNAIALVFEQEQLTYQQLNQRVNQLAHYLQQLGVQPEVSVCICIERSIEMVVGLLAILKAGGAYVPLDPRLPKARLALMLEDVQTPVLLTQQGLIPELPDNLAQMICIDTDLQIAQQSLENPPIQAQPHNLAYTIYTSGSTGKPKGVQVLHSAVVNFLNSMRSAVEVTPQDIIIAVTTLSFDIAALEIFLPLIAGARVVIASSEVVADGVQLLQLLTKSHGTLMQATPATWRLLLAAGWQGSKQLKILCGGEALSRQLANQLLQRCHSLWNLYGPTETTIWSCIHQVEFGDSSISIGRPIANTQIYILDHHLQPTPIGVRGELHIGGAGVARGYLNRPELTQERFISNPFSFEPQARLYKTGDLACYLPDGKIEFLGRLDHQVKVRGFRIELGEIEAVLAQCPIVQESLILARQDTLVAYVVPRGEQMPKVSELRGFLQGNLPDYMIPSAFVLLDGLPLLPNGKVNRHALPAPNTSQIAQGNLFVAPRTPIEEILVNIWAEVLTLEQISIHDNFFELGGHSLLATQLISRIRDTFQVELPLRYLFESPTVAALGDRLLASQQTQLQPLEPFSRSSELPLSFAQARLWFLDQLDPGNCTYNIPVAVQLSGHLQVSALQQSLNEIVRRHEVLRTTFVMGSKHPIQVIPTVGCTDAPQQLSIVDLRDLAAASQEVEVQRLAAQSAKQSFDLAKGPLLQGTLVQLGETKNVLLLTMHHIISDGWSMGVLVQELAVLYEAFSNGKNSPLPELSIQYADFTLWEQQWLQGEVIKTQLAYWKQQLNGAPVTLNLPTDRPRSHENTFKGATTTFALPTQLSVSLQTFSRQQKVTLFMTLLATLQTLLYRYTNQDDIVVGTDVANRNRSEFEPLIGFFVNLLVLRTDLSGNPSFRELLGRVREVALGAYSHQDLPFAKLVEALRPERNLSHTPLFQVLFVLQNTPMPALTFSGLSLTPMKTDTGTTKFDLVLFIEETAQGLIGTWNYSTDLFDHSTIARMSSHFETLLNNIVTEPDTPINSLEMLTETEKQTQIVAQQKRQDAKFKKFKAIQPKAVSLPTEELVKINNFDQEKTLPLVVQSNSDQIQLADWVKSQRELIETKLLKHGAILFRGFNINAVSEFENVAQAICPDLFGEYGDLPRASVNGKVYSSTPYPQDQAILFHNESSHLQTWPLKICFFCVQPAKVGGETPIVDCRQIYQLINPKLRERLEQKQLMYVRNFTKGLDVSWQDFFRTTDKAVVEDYCRQTATDWEWLSDNSLRTRSHRQAIAKHPRNGEMVFFNQLQLHHVSCLEPAVRDSLLSLFSEEQLPRNVYYGDGSPIETSVIQEISEIYQQSQVSFSWQGGDILMLDNMLTAHGRNPYVGSRKIVVAMGEMINKSMLKIGSDKE